jgi:hypothetical protein
MRDRSLPVTPRLLEEMANLSLARAGATERTVGKTWVYRFIKRLPPELKLALVTQRTKEHKRIQAEDEIDLPVLSAPDLPIFGEKTPSPPPTALSSSSVENTPPRSIQALEKNHQKLSKIDTLTPKQRRGLLRVLEHNKVAAEQMALSNEIIRRMLAAHGPPTPELH